MELVLIPSLLLADEPTSGLDSTAALQLAILLRECERRPSSHRCTNPGRACFNNSRTSLSWLRVVVAYAGPAETAASTCASLEKSKCLPLTSAAEVLLDLVDDPATRSILVSQKPLLRRVRRTRRMNHN